MKLRSTFLSAAMIAATGCLLAPDTKAQNVGAEVFSNPYTDWVNPYYTVWEDPADPSLNNARWRLSLHNPTLMDTNNANPPTSGAVSNSGVYEADFLINDTFLAPSAYSLTSRMYTNDDDIIGLVWNYQDPDNYFRVGIRQQASGTFGGTQGLAVQKVVGGVLTQISPVGNVAGAPSPIEQLTHIDARQAFNLSVEVDGSDYRVLFDGNEIVSGTDADLAAGRKIGVQSWAQQSDVGTVTPYWGTEVESISVVGDAGPLYSESFDARPVPFRQLVMTNGAGVSGNSVGASREPLGNFGIAFAGPWINQHSNGFLYGTAVGANVLHENTDFIGPAVVVDEAGSEEWANYEVRTRIGTADNDGLGVLVRVQDDQNFYRVNFAAEAVGSNPAQIRSPRGLSVQKVQNGVWSRLFQEDQENPVFLPVDNANTDPSDPDFAMFDLSVKAIGNTLLVQVIDHEGNVFNYAPIEDPDNPLLTGTAGLTTWGSPDVYFMEYGGAGSGEAFVRYIPEPATVALGGIAALALVGLRRRTR